MSTNYHTPIAVGAPANAAVVNAPLGELDAAIDQLSGNSAAGGVAVEPWPELDEERIVVKTVSAYDASSHANFSSSRSYFNSNTYSELVTVHKMLTYSISRRFGTVGSIITQPLDSERFTFYGRLGITSTVAPLGGIGQTVYAYFGDTVNPMTTGDNSIENYSVRTIPLTVSYILPPSTGITVQPVYTWIEAKTTQRTIYPFDSPVTSFNQSPSTGRSIGLILTPGPGFITKQRLLP